MADSEWGCGRCWGQDPRLARLAVDRPGEGLVQEPHFAVSLVRCACGQAFASVLTERVDWSGDGDDLLLRWVPLAAEDLAALRALPPQGVGAELARLARGRRHLAHQAGGAPERDWWIEGSFTVGP